MNYCGLIPCDIANGNGVRVTLFVSGCTLHCKGCQNPQTWDFNAGKPFDDTAKQGLFEALDHPWIQGLTLSGGHPLEKENIECVLSLIKECKIRWPDKDIWLYTGLKLSLEDICQVLRDCDVVVDGAYVDDLRDISLKFRGSSNQRLIDVKKTIKNQEITLWSEENV